jgi:talin
MGIMANVPGYDAATPEDVIKAAREVTGSIADLVFATNQDEVVAAAQKALVATEKLLNSAFTAARLSPDPNISRALEDAVKNTAQQMCKLLETAKLNRQDPATQAKLEQASSDVTNSMNNTVTALRALPNAADLSLDEGQDLEKLATDELAAAAKVIEEAAATLARARPKHTVKDPSILDEATITDAIFAAAIAIAQATAKLVGAATVAQVERAEKSKTPAGRKYHSDPTWANGLISAAKSVAGAVKQLVSAANAAAQGKADQEVLIASARAVAAATAQLVSASRAKADPNSKSQNALGEAAKLVTGATTKLVQAAQTAAQYKEDEVEVAESSGMAQSQQAKFDQQIRILKLEAQIEAERRRLAKMNQAAYKGGK